MMRSTVGGNPRRGVRDPEQCLLCTCHIQDLDSQQDAVPSPSAPEINPRCIPHKGHLGLLVKPMAFPERPLSCLPCCSPYQLSLGWPAFLGRLGGRSSCHLPLLLMGLSDLLPSPQVTALSPPYTMGTPVPSH